MSNLDLWNCKIKIYSNPYLYKKRHFQQIIVSNCLLHKNFRMTVLKKKLLNYEILMIKTPLSWKHLDCQLPRIHEISIGRAKSGGRWKKSFKEVLRKNYHPLQFLYQSAGDGYKQTNQQQPSHSGRAIKMYGEMRDNRKHCASSCTTLEKIYFYSTLLQCQPGKTVRVLETCLSIWCLRIRVDKFEQKSNK